MAAAKIGENGRSGESGVASENETSKNNQSKAGGIRLNIVDNVKAAMGGEITKNLANGEKSKIMAAAWRANGGSKASGWRRRQRKWRQIKKKISKMAWRLRRRNAQRVQWLKSLAAAAK
jgi:hypothetical protein